jgi:methanogenic corrinoid protein MtbC1
MPDRSNNEPRLPVRTVIGRTGLSADLLRAWERRYDAVRPQRSKGGQRLYSEQDVARLTLLRRASLAGHSIGEVARLDITALEALLDEPPADAALHIPDAVAMLVREAIGATERLEAAALEAILKRGALALGATTFVDDVVSRFLTDVGDRWHDGEMSPAHEHLASSVTRRVLDWVVEAHVVSPRAPRLVVATPAGERHELGAMLVAAAAAEEGWRVVYLGANLPAADVASAARQVRARAVALSAVYGDSETTREEVRTTARALPKDTTLFVGGRAAERAAKHATNGKSERARGATVRTLPDIAALRRALRTLRSASGADVQDAEA